MKTSKTEVLQLLYNSTVHQENNISFKNVFNNFSKVLNLERKFICLK